MIALNIQKNSRDDTGLGDILEALAAVDGRVSTALALCQELVGYVATLIPSCHEANMATIIVLQHNPIELSTALCYRTAPRRHSHAGHAFMRLVCVSLYIYFHADTPSSSGHHF